MHVAGNNQLASQEGRRVEVPAGPEADMQVLNLEGEVAERAAPRRPLSAAADRPAEAAAQCVNPGFARGVGEARIEGWDLERAAPLVGPGKIVLDAHHEIAE